MDGFWRQLQASFVNAAKRQCYYGCAIRALVLAGGRGATQQPQPSGGVISISCPGTGLPCDF